MHVLISNLGLSPFTCLQIQPLRVGEPPSVQRAVRGPRERVHPTELALVHHRLAHAARLRYSAEVSYRRARSIHKSEIRRCRIRCISLSAQIV